jgi:cyclic-di-AMP phosphodiesterase PgpH
LLPAPADRDRKEMLKEPHERPRPFGRRDAFRFIAAISLLVLAVGAGAAFDLAPSSPGYAAGAVASATVHAPTAADIPNEVETQQARAAAAAAVTPRYDYTPEKASTIADTQVAALSVSLSPIDNIFNTTKSADVRKAQLQSAMPNLGQDELAILEALDPSRWAPVELAAEATLRIGERLEIKDTDLAAQRTALASANVASGLADSEKQLAAALAAPWFVGNSSYSESLTQKARDDAAKAVATIVDHLQAGQVIVDQGHVISEATMVDIKYFGLDTSRVDWARSAAWVVLGILTAGLLLSWIWRYRPEYWHRGQTLVLIGLIFVLGILLVKLPGGRAWLPYLVPTAAAGMLLTLLLDAGMGVVMVALVAALAGLVNGSSLEIATYVFLGGFAGTLAVRKGERQHFFVQAGIAVAMADIVVVAAFALLGQHDMAGMLQLWGAAAGGAVIATVVTIGSFSLLGNLFGILTESQLLELANPTQPLMRRLLVETPGTYHHSLMVGNLAERAAAAIGADPLLARAAAYYHDIGKLANPVAFIENQSPGENVHDQLEPEVSSAILRQHVADGIDLAYKAGLPKPLIAFIPQHHGTAVLGYVYGKAREAAAEPYGGLNTAAGKAAADAVDQSKFRHSGPKPQSREAAVLMLADGVEASVRSLSSRDEATIRAMVGQIIQERLDDGQLNECDITIRDLENVREAFVGQLLGMYHQRIAYPQSKIVELESRRDRGLGS